MSALDSEYITVNIKQMDETMQIEDNDDETFTIWISDGISEAMRAYWTFYATTWIVKTNTINNPRADLGYRKSIDNLALATYLTDGWHTNPILTNKQLASKRDHQEYMDTLGANYE